MGEDILKIRTENKRDPPKFNVWCINYDPQNCIAFFMDWKKYDMSYIYTTLERLFVILQLRDIPNIIYQLVSTSTHWSLGVHFPERWIWRGRPIGWEARSPDVTHGDLFFWGFMKDHVYCTKINSLNELT